MTTENKYVLDLLINLDNSMTVLNSDVDKDVPYPPFDPSKAMQSYRRIAEVFELQEQTFIDFKPPEVSLASPEVSVAESEVSSSSKTSSKTIEAASTASGLESPDVAEVAGGDKAGRKEAQDEAFPASALPSPVDTDGKGKEAEDMDVEATSDALPSPPATKPNDDDPDVVILAEAVSDQRLVSWSMY